MIELKNIFLCMSEEGLIYYDSFAIPHSLTQQNLERYTSSYRIMLHSNFMFQLEGAKVIKSRHGIPCSQAYTIASHFVKDGLIYVSMDIISTLATLDGDEQKYVNRVKLIPSNGNYDLCGDLIYFKSLNDANYIPNEHQGIILTYFEYLRLSADYHPDDKFYAKLAPIKIERMPYHIQNCENIVAKKVLDALYRMIT